METKEDLKKMFADYQKNNNQSKKISKEDILSKYFVARKAKEIFRILPYKTKNFWDEAYFHVVPTHQTGGTIKENSIIYCPAHNDPPVPKMDTNGNPVTDLNGKAVMIPAPCPLCDKAKVNMDKQDLSIKYVKKDNYTPAQKVIKASNDLIYKEATKWESKKFYIIRGIDKGQEKDGVKFWRFKFNYRKQGTLDKLMPILEDFCEINQVHFADVNEGTDLSITMGDSEFMGITYKAISAISTRGKSPLHADKIIAQQWLDDTIHWRDVFKPKSAPTITPFKYLELIVEGNTPYWDDNDTNNKHWVFPNNPELEALANTRKNSNNEDAEHFEYASDIAETNIKTTYSNIDNVNISNVTKTDVGAYNDNSVDVGASVLKEAAAEQAAKEPVKEQVETPVTPAVTEKPKETSNQVTGSKPENFDDLPF